LGGSPEVEWQIKRTGQPQRIQALKEMPAAGCQPPLANIG